MPRRGRGGRGVGAGARGGGAPSQPLVAPGRRKAEEEPRHAAELCVSRGGAAVATRHASCEATQASLYNRSRTAVYTTAQCAIDVTSSLVRLLTHHAILSRYQRQRSLRPLALRGEQSLHNICHNSK